MASNRVRERIETVFDEIEFEHVTIADDAIVELAEEWAGSEFPVPDWTGGPFPGDGTPNETLLDLFLLVGANNFQFHVHGETYRATYDGDTWEGAFAMWRSFVDALERGVPITDGEYLRDLSVAETRALFRGDADDDTEIPMLEARRDLLTTIGDALCAEYGGQFHSGFDAAGTVELFDDGDGFVETLVADFPAAFDDTREFRGQSIPFDKKAQLTASTLYGRFRDEAFFTPTDVDRLTLFADYVVPANLRANGVLVYDDRLARQVDSQAELPVGSRAEVEIRAGTVLAADRLLGAIDDRRDDPIGMPQLDYQLWRRGRELDTTYHAVRTTAY